MYQQAADQQKAQTESTGADASNDGSEASNGSSKKEEVEDADFEVVEDEK
mgnify:CR=1 FL=1